MLSDFECDARVRYQGGVLALNKIISEIDIEDIMPSRNPISDPFEFNYLNQKSERRRRFVDMIAAEFAQALTEALYKIGEK